MLGTGGGLIVHSLLNKTKRTSKENKPETREKTVLPRHFLPITPLSPSRRVIKNQKKKKMDLRLLGAPL
jgi:hypothetical protein